jgi:hypothetical protein
MKRLLLFTIIVLAFGCSSGDDGSENAVPSVTQTFLEKYSGKGFGTAGDKYFFFQAESGDFFSVVDQLNCTGYKPGQNWFQEGSFEVCYIKKIKDGDDVDSGGEDYDELVIEANCNYDNVLTPTDTSYDQKVIFRVEKAGEWLTVTYDAGFEDIKETHYKTTETLQSLCY